MKFTRVILLAAVLVLSLMPGIAQAQDVSGTMSFLS